MISLLEYNTDTGIVVVATEDRIMQVDLTSGKAREQGKRKWEYVSGLVDRTIKALMSL